MTQRIDDMVSLRRVERILVNLGSTCTRKQAKANDCVHCGPMYKRLDALLRPKLAPITRVTK